MKGAGTDHSGLRFLRGLRLLAVCAGLAGCGPGSGEGLDISGRPLSEGGNVPLAPTLASIQANIFDPSCVVCHSGAGAPQGLRLDSRNSFTNLVGVPSRQDSSLLRVAPGNPDQSYLIRKLEGSASVGQQMPLGGPPIPQSTINFLRQWISDGALPDAAPPPGTAPAVISFAPAPDSVVAELPAEITAGFDQEVDASTINGSSFRLVRSGGDGQFGNGNDVSIVPASIGVSGANPRLAVMNLSGVVPVEDVYRVTLQGSGANLILGINALALDGEFTGVFPSGDGAQGGDFVADFELRRLQPTLASIQENIFTPTCSLSGCHSGPAGPVLPSGMDLSSESASAGSLVNVASLQDPMILRVAAGDADSSYLVDKLEGTAAQGSRMPQGGPFLDQATIDVIRLWIDNGASP